MHWTHIFRENTCKWPYSSKLVYILEPCFLPLQVDFCKHVYKNSVVGFPILCQAIKFQTACFLLFYFKNKYNTLEILSSRVLFCFENRIWTYDLRKTFPNDSMYEIWQNYHSDFETLIFMLQACTGSIKYITKRFSREPPASF